MTVMVTPISGPIDLKAQRAIVTGAARGIGQAICCALAREGADVAACDIIRVSETVEKIEKKGRKAIGLEYDARRQIEVKRVVEEVVDVWGGIDILINNAGILGDSSKAFEDITVDEWDTMLITNLRGTFLMTQAVWPHLVKQGRGKIVCLGSIAGRIGGVLANPHYSASKGGVHAFVKWAAKKGVDHGIYVNGIAPGPIVTPMTKNEPYKEDMVPLGRLGQPEDIAEVALFLSSQSSNFITGNIIDVNGGILMV
jgi:NAD(P)-dependent dehydrogenase (short-subunit alcohol dehydrogenase family)